MTDIQEIEKLYNTLDELWVTDSLREDLGAADITAYHTVPDDTLHKLQTLAFSVGTLLTHIKDLEAENERLRNGLMTGDEFLEKMDMEILIAENKRLREVENWASVYAQGNLPDALSKDTR